MNSDRSLAVEVPKSKSVQPFQSLASTNRETNKNFKNIFSLSKKQFRSRNQF